MIDAESHITIRVKVMIVIVMNQVVAAAVMIMTAVNHIIVRAKAMMIAVDHTVVKMIVMNAIYHIMKKTDVTTNLNALKMNVINSSVTQIQTAVKVKMTNVIIVVMMIVAAIDAMNASWVELKKDIQKDMKKA